MGADTETIDEIMSQGIQGAAVLRPYMKSLNQRDIVEHFLALMRLNDWMFLRVIP